MVDANKRSLLAKRKLELDHAVANDFPEEQIAKRIEKIRKAAIAVLKKYRGAFANVTDAPGNKEWYSRNSDSETHPVGQKSPNQWGLYDMHGNVWEWCWDWFTPNYHAEVTQTSNQSNGLESTTERVLRGGSFCFAAWNARSSYRMQEDLTVRSDNFGFRIARDSIR